MGAVPRLQQLLRPVQQLRLLGQVFNFGYRITARITSEDGENSPRIVFAETPSVSFSFSSRLLLHGIPIRRITYRAPVPGAPYVIIFVGIGGVAFWLSRRGTAQGVLSS